MSKKKMKFFLYLEYLSLKAVEFMLNILPRPVTLRLGAFAGLILYKAGVYRKTVRTNMEYIGLWDEEKMQKITLNLYRNIGRYASDFLRSSSGLPPHKINNPELLDSTLNAKRGTLLLLAHLGNWEILAKMYGQKTKDLNVVAKPMKNEFVDKWLAEKRKKASVSTIYTSKALRKMLEVIKRNGLVAILIDQHAGRHGTMVPFLGKMANTVRAVAALAEKTGCEVLTVYAVMLLDGSYNIWLQKAPSPGGEIIDEEQRIAEYLKVHNEIVSSWVREYPEHWFGWFHKRFRGTIRY